MERSDVIVIGGGLAGLAAAATAARAGAKVVVVEARRELGGRAGTEDRQGFLLNLGPHALYLAGAGRGVLGGFGIDPPGGYPKAAPWVRDGDLLAPLPTDVRSMLRTRLLGWPAKVELARLFSRLRTLDPAPLAGETLSAWLDEEVHHPEVRRLMELLVRISSYAHAPELLSAGAAIEQLQLGLRGVRYVDGGWQSIVRELRQVAVTTGATIVAAQEAAALERGSSAWTVSTPTASWEATAVVVATGGPETAFRLLGVDPWCTVAPVVTVSSLDLGLRQPPEHPLLFGADRPLYLSTHAPAASLAPPGQALAAAMRYHAPGESLDHHDVRAELEDHAARAGVRQADVVLRRYLHRSVVTHGLPLAAEGGLAGRPGVAVPGLDRAFVAGDWVGSVGQLADASLASGRAAGQAAVTAIGRAPTEQAV